MAETTKMRTRIVVFLPAPATLPQFLHVDNVITDLVLIADGATYSKDIDPVFVGRWLDTVAYVVKTDQIMIVVADTIIPQKSSNLLHLLSRIKVRSQADLGQDIVWITLQDVSRVSTHDYIR